MADEDTDASGSDNPGENEGQDDEPQKQFSQEQVENLISDRVKRERRRLQSELRDELRTELLVDDAFRREALNEWEVDTGSDDGGGLDDEKVQDLYQTWEQEKVEPIKEEKDRLASEVQNLREGRLESEILSSARGLAEKGLLKRQANGNTALFNMIGGEFTWDDEEQTWRVKGEDGDFLPSPSGDRLYMTVEEYIRNVWAEDPDNAPFVTDNTQGGSDYQGSGSGGGKRTYTRKEYKRLVDDSDYYAKHRDELLAAEREGRVK